eukprot:4572595-Alexandrium_andersonii.AAC.1
MGLSFLRLFHISRMKSLHGGFSRAQSHSPSSSRRPAEPQPQNPNRNGALAAALAALPELP